MLALREAGEPSPKSTRQAYILLAVLGVFGAHRFYLGHGTSAATQLILTLIGLATLNSVGGPFLALVGLWLIFDALTLPMMLRRANHRDAPLGPCPITRDADRAWH